MLPIQGDPGRVDDMETAITQLVKRISLLEAQQQEDQADRHQMAIRIAHLEGYVQQWVKIESEGGSCNTNFDHNSTSSGSNHEGEGNNADGQAEKNKYQ